MTVLPAQSQLRFEDSGNATVTGRHYDLFLGSDLLFRCDTEGQCIKRPTEFLPGTEAEAPEWTLRATRKVLNFRYHLEEGRGGERLGTLDCKAKGALWKLLDEREEEVARIIDPTKWSTDLIRTALGGSPDVYCLVRGDELLATIERLPRPQKNQETGRVRKFFQKLLTLYDWALCVRTEISGPLAGLAIAGTLLSIEHQIRKFAECLTKRCQRFFQSSTNFESSRSASRKGADPSAGRAKVRLRPHWVSNF